MHLMNPLLSRQANGCVQCPPTPPCSCSANQQCYQISRDCNTCGSSQCVDVAAPSKSGSGTLSSGALAGVVIVVILFVAAVIAFFLWYRPRMAGKMVKEVVDIPAPASTVLNRPDPIEKQLSSPTVLEAVRSRTATSDADHHPRPSSRYTSSLATTPLGSTRASAHTNPFSDGQSIQTTGTDGTNAIPIALVPPLSPRSKTNTLSPGSPTRPDRSPEIDLNLDHVNVSRETLRATSSLSHASGLSGISARQSYMSAASYTSDFLNEAPMIITPNKGAFRQVLGVVKAEVINTQGPGSSTTSLHDTLQPPRLSRPSVGSPLASASFVPSDMGGYDTSPTDPFGDQHSPTPSSPALSHTIAGNMVSQSARDSTASEWIPPKLPRRSGDFSRPSSMSTQAGSVVDISSATRVNVGLSSAYTSPLSAGFPRAEHRTTMGRLISPTTASSPVALEQQQQLAIAHAQRRAQAQGLEPKRRVSGSSVLSAASVSTRADSILASFPFVPPSPISNRPMRSPPCSPLGQQSFPKKQTPKEISPPPSDPLQDSLPPPPPPTRHTLGLSSASELSTSSTGLGSFAFHIDSDNTQDVISPPPATLQGRQRASLDTLALTSDLSSYPLAFDPDTRDSVATERSTGTS